MVQCCDYEYFLRLVANEGLFFIDEPLVSFRVHPGSATADNIKKKRFRMDTMDSLILLHEIVFNPHYHKFRAAVCEKRANIDFVNLFAWFARDTFQQARSNPEDLKYFLEIAMKYPAISLCKNASKFSRHSLKNMSEYQAIPVKHNIFLINTSRLWFRRMRAESYRLSFAG